MTLDFILDEDYLAFSILIRKMYEEKETVTDFKNKLRIENDLGYKKMMEEEILDTSIYLKNSKINSLIEEFISTDIFNEIYKLYNNDLKNVIAIKILKNIISPNNDELIKIENDLWIKHFDGYWDLLSINSFNPEYFLLDENIKKTVQLFKETDDFKQLYQDTYLYLEDIKKYWNDNKKVIDGYLEKTLRINTNMQIKVYIVHPNTCEGHSFNNDCIIWGHYKGLNDPNYNLVYLVHEVLHCLLPFERNETDIKCYIKHAVIELISDYELYSLFKKESTLKEGHSYLDEYKKFLYPYWLMYLGLDNSQIKERFRRDKLDQNGYIYKENINIKNMNIQEFITFGIEKYYEQINITNTKK